MHSVPFRVSLVCNFLVLISAPCDGSTSPVRLVFLFFIVKSRYKFSTLLFASLETLTALRAWRKLCQPVQQLFLVFKCLELWNHIVRYVSS